jgi:molybdopterin molybdotransferase
VASTAVAPETLSVAQARARVLAAASPLPPERVPLAEARGRALRSAVTAPRALLAPGEAMRIMTGAPMPEGADADVPVEEVEVVAAGGTEDVRIARAVQRGENVRDAGADVAAGEVVLEAGRELSPHDLAMAAALGLDALEVGPRPRAVVLSTGDELLDPGATLTPGAIYDSNLPLLAALLEEAGARVVRAMRAPDDPGRVAHMIAHSLEFADVVLTIGGVSAGDFDPVKTSLGALEGIALWRVGMKPGRPQAFGRPRGKLFFGLPGNPASVACVFEVLVRPALRKLQGHEVLERPRVVARAAAAIDSRAGRTDFVRVILERRDDGWWASPAGNQVSGHVAPQSRAHGLLIVPEPLAGLAAGQPAEAIVLRWPHDPAA